MFSIGAGSQFLVSLTVMLWWKSMGSFFSISFTSTRLFHDLGNLKFRNLGWETHWERSLLLSLSVFTLPHFLPMLRMRFSFLAVLLFFSSFLASDVLTGNDFFLLLILFRVFFLLRVSLCSLALPLCSALRPKIFSFALLLDTFEAAHCEIISLAGSSGSSFPPSLP